jgi:ssDNA-binding Zn-finger/Zn-ribbon topoisomerase 1
MIPRCPICKITLELHTGRYGKYYGCPNYPRCTYVVSAHTGRAPGGPSSHEIREARIEAHKALDSLWMHREDAGDIEPGVQF